VEIAWTVRTKPTGKEYGRFATAEKLVLGSAELVSPFVGLSAEDQDAVLDLVLRELAGRHAPLA
jgi:hypothetical protein